MKELVARIKDLFGGLDRVHGTYKIDETLSEGKDKVSGQARTVATPPTFELWMEHIEGKNSLGVVPIREDGTVRWACIDIDAYKNNVCQLAIDFIAEYALPFIVCRSKSGGAHVFVFFDEPIPAKLVVKKMAAIASSMGFEGAEIFPKQTEIKPDEFGNWLNMPYFDYEITVRYGFDCEGKELSLKNFLDYAESKKVSHDAWKSLTAPELEHPFNDGPPCIQAMARNRVSEGGRNNALLQFGVYAKIKYGDEDYQDKVAEYNHLYFDPPVPQREMNDTVFKSLSRRDYGYVCNQQPQASLCNKTACFRRKYGVGGAADVEFEQEMELHNLRKLIYYTPSGEPLDDEPEWELTVQGRTIRFTTPQLKNQSQFADRCINKLNIWPPPLPVPRWREMMQSHFRNCEEIEIPFETSPPAQTLEELKSYIARNAHAKGNLDLMNGLVLKKNDCYRFRLESFVEFIRDKSRNIVNAKIISEHLDILGLMRTKTTARQGTEIISLVVWEIGVSQLEIFESKEYQPDTKQEAEF